MDKVWDLDVELVGQTNFISDGIGNQIPVESKTKVMAYEDRISRDEFYKSGQSGITPTKLFIIHPYEYSDETQLIFNNKVYSIIRNYPRNYEELELVCQIKLGEHNE